MLEHDGSCLQRPGLESRASKDQLRCMFLCIMMEKSIQLNKTNHASNVANLGIGKTNA